MSRLSDSFYRRFCAAGPSHLCFVDGLPREAFGVRPACPPSAVLLRRTGWRCRKAWGGPKAGASSTHSKRFAQFGCAFASLRLCVGSTAVFRMMPGARAFQARLAGWGLVTTTGDMRGTALLLRLWR